MYLRFFCSSLVIILLAVVGISRTAQISQENYAENIGFRFIGTITGENATILVKIIETNEIKAFKVHYRFLGLYIVERIEEKLIELKTFEGKIILVHAEAFAGDLSTPVPPKEVEAPKEEIYSDSFKEEGFEREKNHIKVSQDYVQKLVEKDLSTVLMQAGSEPILEDGQLKGFRMFGIEENSIYAKAGLREGDEILGINGEAITDVGKTISLLKSLKGSSNASFEIRRSGQKTTLTIDVQ